MKRTFLLMFALFGVGLGLSGVCSAAAAEYSIAGTAGSTKYISPVSTKSDAELEDEGYTVIHTAQEFIDAISDDFYAGVALGEDIDFSGIDYTPLGTRNNPFSGIINGNGYKIKNLTIDSTEEYVGLFGATDNAIIENVILENVNIKGDNYVGALVGKAYSTTITNTYVIGGTVEGNAVVGGLVGYSDSSEITTSYTELDLVKANVNCAGGFIGDVLKTKISQSYAKATVETDTRAGVFSGNNHYSNIENSFAVGEVIGRLEAGGFSGASIATTISNSYSSSKVTGTTSVGAFIGAFAGNTKLNIVGNSFFDKEVANITDAVGTFTSSDATQVSTLKGVTTSQMTTPSTFTDAGWDEKIWYLEEGATPQLRVGEDVSGKYSQNIEWTFYWKSESLSIEGIAPSPSYIALPDVPNVTQTGEIGSFAYVATSEAWHPYRHSITNVYISQGVTKIGSYAFWDHRNMKSISIPDSVCYIDGFAFASCSNLTSVTLSYWFRRLTSTAFVDCPKLERIDVCSTNHWFQSMDGVLCGPKEGTLSYKYEKKDVLLRCPPARYKDGRTYSIPENVAEIGDYSFMECSGIGGIEIPDTVWRIGEQAFDRCTGLVHVEIPSSVTDVGSWAFKDCSNLKSMVIPPSVKTFPSSALLGCASLETVFVHADTDFDDSSVPASTSIIRWKITEDGVLVVSGRGVVPEKEEYPWSSQSDAIWSVYVGEGITDVDGSVFRQLDSLEKVYVPMHLKGKIPLSAFDGCADRLVIVYYADGVEDECILLTVVLFDANGGSLQIESVSIVGGYVASLPVPRREGYRFCGWFTERTGGIEVMPGDVITEALSGATLYAHWQDASGLLQQVSHRSDAELEAEGYTVVHTTQEFIDAISDDPWAEVALGEDIDFSGIDYTPLWTGNDPFSGFINGNGYKIKNLTIDSTEDYVGLFGATDGATIENVMLENVNIKGDRYVGALVGRAYSTTITNSYVIGGTVEGGSFVGGLVGYAESVELSEIKIVSVDVKGSNDVGGMFGIFAKSDVVSSSVIGGCVEGVLRVGGISGSNNFAKVKDCFTDVDVFGNDSVGGIAGRNYCTAVEHCYSVSRVAGDSNHGAFCGVLAGNSSAITNSLYDIDRVAAAEYSIAGTAGSTKYISPVSTKSDAELEDEGYTVVHTAQEFIDAISDDFYAGVALGEDIDFSGIDYTPLGTRNNPFSGIINGNGYKIKNLTIDSTEEYVGLFGATDNAIIENVILENVSIKGDRYVGALVGKAFSITITNSYVIGGTVEGNTIVGGLVGYADSSEISTSFVELESVESTSGDTGGFAGVLLKTNVSQSYAKANVKTGIRGGVFSGTDDYSKIENSFALGTITGTDVTGGFSGVNSSTTISNSYASVKVTGNKYYGAFIGRLTGKSASNIVRNSFFDKEVANITDAVGAFASSDATQVSTLKGVTTSQMTTPSTFRDAGWDERIWYLEEGATPQLRASLMKPATGGVGSFEAATSNQCLTLRRCTTAEMKTIAVYGSLGFDDTVWDIRDGMYPNLRHRFIDPFPELGASATPEEVKAALKVGRDSALSNIADVATYNEFRSWANSVSVPSSYLSSVLAVKDSPYAWLSYALDSDSLIADGLKEGDLVIDGFGNGAADGKFELVASVDGISVGNGATDANLRKLFDIEGTSAIMRSHETEDGFSADNVEISVAEPSGGKVKFTVLPKVEGGKTSGSFFFKVKMK